MTTLGEQITRISAQSALDATASPFKYMMVDTVRFVLAFVVVLENKFPREFSTPFLNWLYNPMLYLEDTRMRSTGSTPRMTWVETNIRYLNTC
jgi:hypothetical protein